MSRHDFHTATTIAHGKRLRHRRPSLRVLAHAALGLLALAVVGTRTAAAQVVVNVPCGHHIQWLSEEEATIVLEPCTYPSISTGAGAKAVVEGNGATIDLSSDPGRSNFVFGTLTLRDLTFTGSHVNGLIAGGHLVFERVTITDNHSSFSEGGGGVYVRGIFDNDITFIDSTISNNSGPSGGGIFWEFDGQETRKSLRLIRTTISGNKATGVGNHGYGGGVLFIALGNASSLATLLVENSTISGNTANVIGGGIAMQGEFYHAIINASTLTDNHSPIAGSAFDSFGGVVSIRGSIIIGDCSDWSSSGRDLGYNLLSSGCQAAIRVESTSITVPDSGPGLAPLADNGGLTWTHALLPDSPALDAIPPENCGDLDTDQRGVMRPQGDACDIGAFELVQTTPPPDIAEVIAFFDSALVEGTLQGAGPASAAAKRRDALRNQLLAAADYIEQGDLPLACDQLAASSLRIDTDGVLTPSEFVTGADAPTLVDMLQDLQTLLGCD